MEQFQSFPWTEGWCWLENNQFKYCKYTQHISVIDAKLEEQASYVYTEMQGFIFDSGRYMTEDEEGEIQAPN